MFRIHNTLLRSALLLLVGGLIVHLFAVHPARADEDQLLEDYLNRLSLVDLQLVQMTKRLARTTDKKAQQSLAKSMADLYASQLMTHADNPPKYQRLLQRVESLLQTYPSARTTSIEVMLLQADYNRAETLAGQWVDDPANTQALTEARNILASITPKLVSHHAALLSRIEAIDEEINDMRAGDALDAKTRELQRTEAVAARSRYFAGWSSYYLGIVQGAAAASAEFQQAEKFFREFTEVGGGKLKREDAELLGLDNIWRARAMIGLGITFAARGQIANSHIAFQLLENAIVAPQIQEQAGYWMVRGLLNAGQTQPAIEYAQNRIRNFSGKPTKGRLSMCVALVRQAFAPSISAADQRALVNVGMSGLARLGQPGVIRQLMDKYEIPVDESSGFILHAVKGKQLFDAAEGSGSQQDYQQARDALTSALKAKASDSDVKTVANTTYRLAWCCFRLKEYENAGRNFEDAARALQAVNSAVAVDAAWMAFASYQPISKKNARFATAAVRVLEGIKQDYPKHPYALKADYHISKLMQNASPEEAMESLLSVTPADPNYLNARFDLCALLHRKWTQSKEAERAAIATKLKAAADVYLQADGNDDQKRKLRVSLYVVEALSGSSADAAVVYLNQSQAIAAALPPSVAAVADYHYFAMRMAASKGIAAEQQAHAMWLVDHAPGSNYELSALVTSARAVDARAKTASADKTTLAQAHRIYARLSQRLGATSDVLKAEKNARVAASKTAYYAAKLAKYDEAAPLLEALVTAHPHDESYLRRAGTVQFTLGNFAAALPHWRTLVKGVKRNSDEWHEAKYYQIVCLSKTNKPLAKQVMQQYKVLHPRWGPAALRSRFQALDAQL